MILTRSLPAIFLALALGGCGSEPPHILYETDPQSLDNPLPDLRLVGEQGTRLRPDWFRPFLMPTTVTNRMTQFLKGWTEDAQTQVFGHGNSGPTLLRTSVPVDPTTAVGNVDRLVKTESGYEVLESGVVVEHSADVFVEFGTDVPQGFPDFLLVRPSVPLPDEAEGLLVVRRGLLTRDGVALGRGHGFENEKGSAALIKAAAATLGIEEREVLLVLPQRASHATKDLQHLSQWTNTVQIPSFTIPPREVISDSKGKRPVGVWSMTDPEWPTIQSWLTHWTWANPATHVGKVILGTYKTRDLRGPDGIWKQEWIDNPASAPEVDVTFVLTLPAGEKPAGGYRTVIGAHGLNGRNSLVIGDGNSFCLEVAELLARRQHACLGIDAQSHGSRGSSVDFFALDHLGKTREHFRQTAFDLLQLSKMATVLDVDGQPGPDLNPEFGFFGNSMGSLMGTGFLAFDSRVKYAVLNVGGGGLSNVLVGDDIRGKIGLLLVSKTGILLESPEYYSMFPLMRAMAQLFLEPADPINLAQRMDGKAILLQEGKGDVTIPNFTTENLAKGLKLTAPTESVQGTAPLKVLSRVDWERHGLKPRYNGHNIFWDIEPVRTQVMQFIESKGTQFVLVE